MIPPPKPPSGFELLNTLYERRCFLDKLRYSYNIGTDIYDEITASLKLIDESIFLTLKIINNS